MSVLFLAFSWEITYLLVSINSSQVLGTGKLYSSNRTLFENKPLKSIVAGYNIIYMLLIKKFKY